MSATGLELIVGAIMPLVIDAINKFVTDSRLRYLVSIGICLIVGALFNLGSLSLNNILESGAIVFAAAQTIYKTYYSQSLLREKVYGEEVIARSK